MHLFGAVSARKILLPVTSGGACRPFPPLSRGVAKIAYHGPHRQVLVTDETGGGTADAIRRKSAMTATLTEALLAPDTRPLVVTDCKALLQHEVSGLSGISGAAIKIAYKTVVVF